MPSFCPPCSRRSREPASSRAAAENGGVFASFAVLGDGALLDVMPAEAIDAQFPGKLLAYNCSPSFNWAAKLDADTIARFQAELGVTAYDASVRQVEIEHNGRRYRLRITQSRKIILTAEAPSLAQRPVDF